MASPGIKGAGVVPIILWSKPHQFGKMDGGGAGGGGGEPLMMMAGIAPPTIWGLSRKADSAPWHSWIVGDRLWPI